MKLRAVCEYDKEVDGWSVVCPELPGLTSCGDTEQQVLDNFHEAVELFFTPDYVASRKTRLVFRGALEFSDANRYNTNICITKRPLCGEIDGYVFSCVKRATIIEGVIGMCVVLMSLPFGLVVTTRSYVR